MTSTSDLPSSTPQSTRVLAHTTSMSQPALSLRYPGVTSSSSSSSSSVCTSTVPSTASSPSPPTPPNLSYVEDADITGGGKGGRQEAKQREIVTLSPPSPILSTVDVEVPTAETPKDILDELFDITKQVVEVDDLVRSARKSFSQIERWYEAKSPHLTVFAGKNKVKGVAGDYLKAIEMSVKMAGHGITFAGDAVRLCEYLSSNPSAKVGKFIDEMQQIARLAQGDANNAYNAFSAVRQTLLQIIRRVQTQIEAGQDPIASIRATRRERKIQQDSIDVVELLRQAELDVCELVKCVQKFATWWDRADTTTSGLKQRVVSADGLTMSELRFDGVRESWEDVQKQCKEYKTNIGTLKDFFPVDKKSSGPWIKKIFKKYRQKLARY